MEKIVKIKTDKNTDYKDIRNKVGMELFQVEKESKLNSFSRIFIEIEVCV